MVERYHYVLTSGCRLEDLHLEHAARIQRTLATYCIVAWRLLWQTDEARQNPTASCERALEPYKWQVRSCIHHLYPSPYPDPTGDTPTLRDAVRWIAHLGGCIGRKRDGEPGVTTIWRGFRRLHDLATLWHLLCSIYPVLVDT